MIISKLYGKRVESTSGKKGYVLSVNGGAGRLECIACADMDENEFTIDFRDVVSIGDKIVYEDRTTAMKNAKPIKIGLASFDDEGNFLGTVEDYNFNGTKLISAKIGKKNYPAENLVWGDVIIVKREKRLTQNVVKDGKILFKKGTAVTGELMEKAAQHGEYVQTNLKSI
ncbi:MAG: hypothetical protein K2K80_01860 [Clostridia bacterium]|nr:hypothetical protein [Clostridia bacterium]